MFEGCDECGEATQDAAVDPAGPYLVCGHRGGRQRIHRLPLFVVTGASGPGNQRSFASFFSPMTGGIAFTSTATSF